MMSQTFEICLQSTSKAMADRKKNKGKTDIQKN